MPGALVVDSKVGVRKSAGLGNKDSGGPLQLGNKDPGVPLQLGIRADHLLDH